MELNKNQEENRINFSKEMKNIIIDVFILIIFYINNNIQEEIDINNIKNEFEYKYKNLVSQYTYIDNEILDYINIITENIIDTTLEKYKSKYSFSTDRVLNITVNEANSIFNYTEYKTALLEGKTTKTWVTKMDNKERDTHKEMRNVTIPIYDLFHVGSAEMRFAHDIELASDHMEEIVNCRCVTIYN